MSNFSFISFEHADVEILMRMKIGNTAVSDIESSSVILKTWQKEPEKKNANL